MFLCGISPTHQAFFQPIASNYAISPATLPLSVGSRPSLRPSHFLLVQLAACIISQITLCPPVSWLLPFHPSPTPVTAALLPFSPFSPLYPSIWPSFRLSLPGCRVSLHINRTLVTALPAIPCLLSPSRCSIFSIMYLHTPTFLTGASFSRPAPSIHLCLPFPHHLPLFPLCPSCPLPLSVLTTSIICHPNTPSLFFNSSSVTSLSSFPSVLFSHPSSTVCGIVEAASSVAHHLPPLNLSSPHFSYPPSLFP